MGFLIIQRAITLKADTAYNSSAKAPWFHYGSLCKCNNEDEKLQRNANQIEHSFVFFKDLVYFFFFIFCYKVLHHFVLE